jgi:cytochrome c
MDPMEYAPKNSVALAVLGSILFWILLVAFSNLVFAPRAPKTPGFVLPSGVETAAAPAAPAAPETPLPVLLAKADVAKGKQDAKICTTCHNFDKGSGVKIGPDLWGVVGRPVASVAGFDYSSSLKSMGGDWTYEALNKWIADPKAMASGTKMAFAGETEPQKRADILAYLQSLSDSPVPFPK